MERAAGRDAAGGRHRAGEVLPARPAEGAERVREHLLWYRGVHRALGRDDPGPVTDMSLLRRVRDALGGLQP